MIGSARDGFSFQGGDDVVDGYRGSGSGYIGRIFIIGDALE